MVVALDEGEPCAKPLMNVATATYLPNGPPRGVYGSITHALHWLLVKSSASRLPREIGCALPRPISGCLRKRG